MLHHAHQHVTAERSHVWVPRRFYDRLLEETLCSGCACRGVASHDRHWSWRNVGGVKTAAGARVALREEAET